MKVFNYRKMENTVKGFFNGKEFKIDKQKMTQKEVFEHSPMLYAADIDYITARKLYLSGELFVMPFLTHASQAFEKYLKFISYFIYSNEKEKSHRSGNIFANTNFFKCLDKDDQDLVHQLLDEFVGYRYMDINFKIDILKVLNLLDKFVMEYYKCLINIGVLKFLYFNDYLKLNLDFKGYTISNIVSIIYCSRNKNYGNNIYNISLLKSENRYFEDTCKIFENVNRTPIKINITCKNVIITQEDSKNNS